MPLCSACPACMLIPQRPDRRVRFDDDPDIAHNVTHSALEPHTCERPGSVRIHLPGHHGTPAECPVCSRLPRLVGSTSRASSPDEAAVEITINNEPRSSVPIICSKKQKKKTTPLPPPPPPLPPSSFSPQAPMAPYVHADSLQYSVTHVNIFNSIGNTHRRCVPELPSERKAGYRKYTDGSAIKWIEESHQWVFRLGSGEKLYRSNPAGQWIPYNGS